MPTIEQIRAARALLGWSQHDLADKADLSQTGIARIENGTNQPNSKTIHKIETAFDAADVEFLGSNGVQKKTNEVITYHNIEGFRRFLDEVYEAASGVGGQISVFNSHHINFYKWSGGEEWYKAHAKRMKAVSDKIDMRIIVAEEDFEFIGEGFAEYRWFPKDMWSDQTIYAYGDKLAFLNFKDDQAQIMILKNQKFNEGFNVLFNIAWNEVAKKPQN